MAISDILNRIFDYIGIDLLGASVLFGLFLVGLLLIFLFQMGASRFVVMAFVVPLLLILTVSSGWIPQTWIAGLGAVFLTVLLFIILRRIYVD